MNRRSAIKWTAWTTGISSLPISLSLLPSCKPAGSPDWKPSFLNQEQVVMIENIAEIICPADELTPGAREVHCAEFIDLFVQDCLSSEEQQNFEQGLKLINEECQRTIGKSLTSSNTQQMTSYITNLDIAAFEGQDQPIYQTYRQLKQLVFLGYFTSERIMTTHLNYHAIPGEYRGCIDITKEEKVYVDNNVAG